MSAGFRVEDLAFSGQGMGSVLRILYALLCDLWIRAQGFRI